MTSRSNVPLVLNGLVIALALGCMSCAQRSHVAVRPSSDSTGKLMTQFGKFSPVGSPWTVQVSDSDRTLHISRRMPYGNTGVSPSSWKPQTGWFAFIENEERVWAYDGNRNLYLLTLTDDGTASYGSTVFPCPVPDQVLTRLSPSARRAIKRDG